MDINELTKRIMSINVTSDNGLDEFEKLQDELKPKTEFIKGENVLVSDDGSSWYKSFFVRLVNIEYNYECENNSKANTLWRYCKKLKKLPMHMTDHDGSDLCPVDIDSLVIVMDTSDYYRSGIAVTIDWVRVIRYQVLEDLEA